MGYVNLQPEQIFELLSREDVEILDLRDQYSFDLGHLQGARPANDDRIAHLLADGNREQSILLYCYHGKSSINLAETLSQQGYRQVFNLYGGWKALHKYMQRPGQVENLLYGVK